MRSARARGGGGSDARCGTGCRRSRSHAAPDFRHAVDTRGRGESTRRPSGTQPSHGAAAATHVARHITLAHSLLPALLEHGTGVPDVRAHAARVRGTRGDAVVAQPPLQLVREQHVGHCKVGGSTHMGHMRAQRGHGHRSCGAGNNVADPQTVRARQSQARLLLPLARC